MDIQIMESDGDMEMVKRLIQSLPQLDSQLLLGYISSQSIIYDWGFETDKWEWKDNQTPTPMPPPDFTH